MRDVTHKYPSQEAERFQVRMPDGLRDRLREAAAANGRSMNSEIVARLEKSFDLHAGPLTSLEVRELVRQIANEISRQTNAKRGNDG